MNLGADGTIRKLILFSLTWSALNGTSALAQEKTATHSGTVRQHARPSALRFFKPNVWGTTSVELTNSSAEPANIVTAGYFSGASLKRYGRQVTVPPESTRVVTFPVLPTATDKRSIVWHPLLYSADDDQGTLLRASDDYVIDSELLAQPAEKITAVIADIYTSGAEQLKDLVDLAVVTRITFGQTRRLVEMDVEDIPVDANGLDLVDQIILGSNRIAEDPARLSCLRSWVEQGGLLWVRLDMVDVATVKHLFGDGVQIQFEERSGMTSLPIYNRVAEMPTGELLRFDYPVEFIRVLVDGVEVLHEVNSWPASFARTIGKGRVMFTTLGNRGWIRDRNDNDPPAPTEFYSNFVARKSLVEVLDQWTRATDPMPLDASDFEPLLAAQIGYRIPGKGTILSLLGLFCSALLGIGWTLYSSQQRDDGKKQAGRSILPGRHLERLAVVGPVLAILTAVPIVVLGQASRNTVPASVNLAEFVEVMPGTSTVRSTGSVALFAPDADSIDLTASRGRVILPQTERLTGTMQQMIQTDFGRSKWSDLSVHAGLQFYSTRQTRLLEQPMRAIVTFGPNGVDGTFETGSFGTPEDMVIASRSLNVLAINWTAQNRLSGGADETLAPGVYAAGSLLTDQQVQRQHVYRSLLEAGTTSRFPRDPVLLAWMCPGDLSLGCPDGFNTTHRALVAIPLEYGATPPGTSVYVPSPFLTFEAATTDSGGTTTVYDNRTGMWSEGFQHTQTLLRFNVPKSVKPLTISRVNIEFKLLAPGREVSFTVGRRGSLVNAGVIDEAAGKYNLTLTDADQVQLDPDGGYYMEIGVKPPKDGSTGTAAQRAWKIDFVRLELFGRTTDRVDGATTTQEGTDE